SYPARHPDLLLESGSAGDDRRVAAGDETAHVGSARAGGGLDGPAFGVDAMVAAMAGPAGAPFFAVAARDGDRVDRRHLGDARRRRSREPGRGRSELAGFRIPLALLV